MNEDINELFGSAKDLIITKILAEDYIRRAKRYLREAESAFSEGDFASTIRRSKCK
jgi:hypothetical protein